MTDLIPRDAAIAVLAHDRIRMNVSGTEFRVISTQDHIDAIRAIPAIDPAAIRDAALKEAADIASGHDYSLQSSTAADVRAQNISAAILAMIGEKK